MFIFTSYRLPSMNHNSESGGSRSPERWWLHRLGKEVAKEFVKYGLMVPPGYMLPDSSWGLSEGGMPVPPLPNVGTDDRSHPPHVESSTRGAQVRSRLCASLRYMAEHPRGREAGADR